MQHEVIRHKTEYARGDVHTNTIEGFGPFSSVLGMGSITSIQNAILPFTSPRPV